MPLRSCRREDRGTGPITPVGEHPVGYQRVKHRIEVPERQYQPDSLCFEDAAQTIGGRITHGDKSAAPAAATNLPSIPLRTPKLSLYTASIPNLNRRDAETQRKTKKQRSESLKSSQRPGRQLTLT